MTTTVRIYANGADESGFEEISISLVESGEIGLLSMPFAVESLVFCETDTTYHYDFHQAPVRQFIILLNSEIEVETSLGEKRVFRGGGILRVGDTTRKGHKTRQLSPSTRKSIFVTLKSESI